MMGLDDRLLYFILGCIVGVCFGYLARHIQSIEEKVDHMDELMIYDHDKDAGFIRLPDLKKPSFKDLLLILVLIVVAFGAFRSQDASNQVKKTQDAQATFSYCNTRFLSKTIVTLNERTTYTSDQAKANASLQKSFQVFLEVLAFKPPKSQAAQEDAFYEYLNSLEVFVNLNDKTVGKQEENPFPTIDEYTKCLGMNPKQIQKELDNE